MNRTTLNKATSPDPTPTPGYLFDEIAKVTHDPLGNDRLVEYLVKRLESPSADVKAKVLNIVKHVCRKGNHSFRRAWQREAGVIKAHVQYHTAPDPLRGDEPSKRVREAAKEALEAVFDASRDERKADPQLAGRIQGFGVSPPAMPQQGSSMDGPKSIPTAYAQASYPSSGGGGGGAGASSASRYQGSSRFEGIGNPAFADPRNQPKGFLERVADAVRDKVDKQAENIPGVAGVRPPWMTQGAGDLPTDYSFASNRGGGAYSSGGSYDPTLAQRTPSDNVWTDPRSPRPAYGASGAPLATAQAVPASSGASKPIRTSERSDGKYEQNLVNELCSPGGVRPVPPKDQLDGFCRACRTLDAEWVITFLNQKMQDEDWKVQHKALCVLEAILQTPGLDAFADHLDQAPDTLEALYNAKNPSVRERAQKVWRTLYEDEESKTGGGLEQKTAQQDADLVQTSSPVRTQQSIPAANDLNLLDFGNDAQQSSSSILDAFRSTPATTPPAMPTASSPAALPNMFQNLSVKGSSSTAKPAPMGSSPAPAGGSSGFSFLGGPAPASNQPASSMDLLGLQMPSSSVPTKPSTSAPLDLFSMPISTAPAMQPGVPSSGSALPFIQPAGSMPITTKPTSFALSSSAAAAPKKPADSFNFVQEALQSTKRA